MFLAEVLLDRYGVNEQDLALADTLERGATSSAAVCYVLDQRARLRGQPPVVPVVRPDHERVHALRVLPHRLDAYDTLGDDHEDDHNEDHDI